jgi:hypothetical protein
MDIALELQMFAAGATFSRPDIRDLRSIGVQGEASRIRDDEHSVSCGTGALFDNGLDRCAVCRMALAPPASGVDRSH